MNITALLIVAGIIILIAWIISISERRKQPKNSLTCIYLIECLEEAGIDQTTAELIGRNIYSFIGGNLKSLQMGLDKLINGLKSFRELIS